MHGHKQRAAKSSFALQGSDASLLCCVRASVLLLCPCRGRAGRFPYETSRARNALVGRVRARNGWVERRFRPRFRAKESPFSKPNRAPHRRARMAPKAESFGVQLRSPGVPRARSLACRYALGLRSRRAPRRARAFARRPRCVSPIEQLKRVCRDFSLGPRAEWASYSRDLVYPRANEWEGAAFANRNASASFPLIELPA